MTPLNYCSWHACPATIDKVRKRIHHIVDGPIIEAEKRDFYVEDDDSSCCRCVPQSSDLPIRYTDHLLTRDDPQFLRTIFTTLWCFLGLGHLKTTLYDGQTNVQVEKYTKPYFQDSDNTSLSTEVSGTGSYPTDFSDQRRIFSYTRTLTYAYNTQVHLSTAVSPFSLILSRHPPEATLFNFPPVTSLEFSGNWSLRKLRNHLFATSASMREKIVNWLSATQSRWKYYYDKGVRKTPVLRPSKPVPVDRSPPAVRTNSASITDKPTFNKFLLISNESLRIISVKHHTLPNHTQNAEVRNGWQQRARRTRNRETNCWPRCEWNDGIRLGANCWTHREAREDKIRCGLVWIYVYGWHGESLEHLFSRFVTRFGRLSDSNRQAQKLWRATHCLQIAGVYIQQDKGVYFVRSNEKVGGDDQLRRTDRRTTWTADKNKMELRNEFTLQSTSRDNSYQLITTSTGINVTQSDKITSSAESIKDLPSEDGIAASSRGCKNELVFLRRFVGHLRAGFLVLREHEVTVGGTSSFFCTGFQSPSGIISIESHEVTIFERSRWSEAELPRQREFRYPYLHHGQNINTSLCLNWGLRWCPVVIYFALNLWNEHAWDQSSLIIFWRFTFVDISLPLPTVTLLHLRRHHHATSVFQKNTFFFFLTLGIIYILNQFCSYRVETRICHSHLFPRSLLFWYPVFLLHCDKTASRGTFSPAPLRKHSALGKHPIQTTVKILRTAMFTMDDYNITSPWQFTSHLTTRSTVPCHRHHRTPNCGRQELSCSHLQKSKLGLERSRS